VRGEGRGGTGGRDRASRRPPAHTPPPRPPLPDPAAGSAGLVLNVPSRGVIADVGLDASLAGAFAAEPLYCGGPVARSSLHLLHATPGLPGSHVVLPGVFAGGLPAANELVAAGGARAAAAGGFRLLSGYAGWEPGQLEAEAARGAWHIVAAAPALVADVLRGDGAAGAGRGDVWRAVAAVAGLSLAPPSPKKRQGWGGGGGD